MNAFNISEKELTNEVIKDFENSLKSLKNNLLKLKEIEDEAEKKELLDLFFLNIIKLLKKNWLLIQVII